ncbi:MAG: MFS transporter [Chloroflexi bacterium]|nr:MFS transporter [Chloroflexota bacterium]
MIEKVQKTKMNENEFQTEQVMTIVGGHFIHDVYSAFLAPLLPLIIEKLSLTLTMAGSLGAFMQIPAILNPFIGHLADKFSVRYFVIFAPAITGTLMSWMGLAPNYYSLAILLIITGISVAVFHAPAPAMVGRLSGDRIGRGMSWFMAGGELGRTLGPIFAVWAVSTWGLSGIYRVSVLGWAASLILFWRLKDIPGSFQKTSSMRSVLPKINTLFFPLAWIMFFRNFMVVSMTTYLPTFMSMNGASLFLSGAALSILEFAGVGGALISGTLSDRLGRKTVLLFVASLSPLLMLAFLKVSGWVLILFLLLLGFTSLSTGPVFLALVQDHFPRNRAVGNGLFLSISFLLRSLAMVLVGMAGDRIGLQTTFLWSALISLIAIPGILWLPSNFDSEMT